MHIQHFYFWRADNIDLKNVIYLRNFKAFLINFKHQVSAVIQIAVWWIDEILAVKPIGEISGLWALKYECWYYLTGCVQLNFHLQ